MSHCDFECDLFPFNAVTHFCQSSVVSHYQTTGERPDCPYYHFAIGLKKLLFAVPETNQCYLWQRKALDNNANRAPSK